MLQQFLKFGLVGALATSVHMIIGFLLIQSGWPPLWANLGAFTIAFFVSFIGHLGFSFADQDARFRRSLSRFVIVALIGFSVNQSLLAGLSAFGWVSKTTSLLISTSCAALITFGLSKFWVFLPEWPRTSGQLADETQLPRLVDVNLPDQKRTN